MIEYNNTLEYLRHYIDDTYYKYIYKLLITSMYIHICNAKDTLSENHGECV